MRKSAIIFQTICFVIFLSGLLAPAALAGENLDNLTYRPGPDMENGLTVEQYSLGGYTKYWYEYSGIRYRYAGLYSESFEQPQGYIRKIEDNVRKELLLEELWIQKGFIAKLAKSKPENISPKSLAKIYTTLAQKEVLVIGTDRDEAIDKLLEKIPEELRFLRTRAFYLENGKNTLFVIASHTQDEADRLRALVDKTLEFMNKYKMYKGIAGAGTNYFSLSSLEGNPLDVIASAMNLRCSWILLSGYNDWMTAGAANDLLDRVEFDFVVAPGQYGSKCVMYGMDEYPAVQDNTLADCYEWTKEHGGFIFSRPSNKKKKRMKF